MEYSQELTLTSINDTLNNIKNISNISLNDITNFSNNKLTAKTAKQYIDLMTDLINKMEELDVSKEQKEQFRSLFIFLFSKMCESDCKGIMLSKQIQNNKKYKKIINQLGEDYQKERDDHNALAKKYNEKQKEEKISVPGISLSLTLKETKTLNSYECVDLMNEIEIEDEEFDKKYVKYTRVSVPNDYKDKVNRAYVKSSPEGNHTIQKTSKKKSK